MRSALLCKSTILLFMIFFSEVCHAQSADSSGVKIRYYNKTGYHLDSLVIGRHYIGRIEDGSSTDFLIYDSVLLFDGYFFSPQICAKIGKVYEKDCFEETDYGYCGVGAAWFRKGIIIVDINIKADIGEFRLFGKNTQPIK